MSPNDLMNLEMELQNSEVGSTVATTVTTAVEINRSARSPGVDEHAETPKENPAREGPDIMDSTISVDATMDNFSSKGATMAVITDSSSKQPAQDNGDTEALNLASVEGEHDGVGLAKVDNVNVKDVRSESVAPAMENNSISQLPAVVNGHAESPNPPQGKVSSNNILPTAINHVEIEVGESEHDVATEPRSEGEEGAEWEIDSSPIQSSSSDTSSDSSSSSDDSDASDGEEYTSLDPAEQARMLMEGDGGSDDEGGNKGTAGGQLRTKNEKPDDIVEKPDVKVTPDMAIEALGVVENTVQNLVLIKAKTSGEYRVLETGSVLCLEDRTVIGVVAETLGRVQQPYYSVRFTNAAGIAEAGIAKDTRIFYVEQYSTYVFTQPLKAFKGSDASNLHDEEVGEDEMEFSDDEAEAEYKRRAKQDRRARKDAKFGPPGGSVPGERNSGPRSNGPRRDVSMRYDDSTEIKYDNNDGDELYTPLARPANLHELMDRGGMPVEGRTAHAGTSRGSHGGRGGHDRGRGRGDRGRGGRSGRGDKGRERYGRGSGAPSQNGDRRPPYQEQQRQHGYGAPLMSPAAPPPFAPQQSHASPQTDTYSQQAPSQPPFQQMYPPQSFPPPQQLFPQPHPSPQPGFSLPPANYHAQQQQQQRYPPRQPYQPPQPYPSPSQHQNQHRYPQPYQYPPYQQTPNHYPTPHPTQNPSLPPGAFLNPAFFRNQPQPNEPQPPHPPPQTSNQYPARTAWSPPQPQPQPSPLPSLPTQYPSPNAWPAPTAYGPGHGLSQGAELVGGKGQDAAFRAAQEKLSILRGLGGGGGGQGG